MKTHPIVILAARALVVGLLAFLVPAGAFAQAAVTADHGEHTVEITRSTGFLFRSVEVDGQEYRYTVYRPRGLDASIPAPALIFLHGSGECGTDGSKPLAVGLPPAVMLEPDRWPFVIIIPQKPTRNSEWEDHDDAVIAMLDRTIREQHVDPDRVAITGLSQGGHGTIQIAAKHPDRFRAAAPVCGYINAVWHNGERAERSLPQAEEADRLARAYEGVPTWIFHGERDPVVPADQSRRLHQILEDAGRNTRLTIFPDDDHNSWDSTYRRSGLWEWLAEQTRAR